MYLILGLRQEPGLALGLEKGDLVVEVSCPFPLSQQPWLPGGEKHKFLWVGTIVTFSSGTNPEWAERGDGPREWKLKTHTTMVAKGLWSSGVVKMFWPTAEPKKGQSTASIQKALDRLRCDCCQVCACLSRQKHICPGGPRRAE